MPRRLLLLAVPVIALPGPREARATQPVPGNATASTLRTALSAAPVLSAGSGNLPDGDYKCYAATSTTVLSGPVPALNFGQFLTRIRIRGNTYQTARDSVGRYTVGASGRITWSGGPYSGKTVARYVLDRGEAAILLGDAETEAGLVCRR